MRMKRLAPLSLILGGCHVLASMLIVPFTLWIGAVMASGPLKAKFLGVLHFLTAILYFPIISLALYPRQLFPGSWIYVPIMANSLLWGLLLACVVVGWRNIRHNPG